MHKVLHSALKSVHSYIRAFSNFRAMCNVLPGFFFTLSVNLIFLFVHVYVDQVLQRSLNNSCKNSLLTLRLSKLRIFINEIRFWYTSLPKYHHKNVVYQNLDLVFWKYIWVVVVQTWCLCRYLYILVCGCFSVHLCYKKKCCEIRVCVM